MPTSTCPASATPSRKVWGKHTVKAGLLLGADPQRAAGQQHHATASSTFRAGQLQYLGQPLRRHVAGQPELVQRDLLQPHQRHLLQHLRRVRTGLLEGEPPPDAGTRPAHYPLHSVGGQSRLRLLGLRLFEVQLELHAHPVLRLPLEQADSSVPMGGFPTKGAVLPAALRRRVRPLRQRQHRAARRLGTLLLPLRPVHHRPQRLGRHADGHLEQQPGYRRHDRCWPANSTR